MRWLWRVLIGVALGWAAVTKWRDPGLFLEALEGHPWLSSFSVSLLGAVVPAAEAVVAVALLTGLWVRGAWWWALALGVGFVAYVSSAWALGLTLNCGCFGEDRPLDGLTWLRAVAFFAAAAVGVGWEAWQGRTEPPGKRAG